MYAHTTYYYSITMATTNTHTNAIADTNVIPCAVLICSYLSVCRC